MKTRTHAWVLSRNFPVSYRGTSTMWTFERRFFGAGKTLAEANLFATKREALEFRRNLPYPRDEISVHRVEVKS